MAEWVGRPARLPPPSAVREIGFVLPMPLARQVRPNPFSINHLSSKSTLAELALFRTLRPSIVGGLASRARSCLCEIGFVSHRRSRQSPSLPAVPSPCPQANWLCLARLLSLTGGSVKAFGLGDGLPAPPGTNWLCFAQWTPRAGGSVPSFPGPRPFPAIRG